MHGCDALGTSANNYDITNQEELVASEMLQADLHKQCFGAIALFYKQPCLILGERRWCPLSSPLTLVQ